MRDFRLFALGLGLAISGACSGQRILFSFSSMGDDFTPLASSSSGYALVAKTQMDATKPDYLRTKVFSWTRSSGAKELIGSSDAVVVRRITETGEVFGSLNGSIVKWDAQGQIQPISNLPSSLSSTKLLDVSQSGELLVSSSVSGSEQVFFEPTIGGLVTGYPKTNVYKFDPIQGRILVKLESTSFRPTGFGRNGAILGRTDGWQFDGTNTNANYGQLASLLPTDRYGAAGYEIRSGSHRQSSTASLAILKDGNYVISRHDEQSRVGSSYSTALYQPGKTFLFDPSSLGPFVSTIQTAVTGGVAFFNNRGTFGYRTQQGVFTADSSAFAPETSPVTAILGDNFSDSGWLFGSNVSPGSSSRTTYFGTYVTVPEPCTAIAIAVALGYVGSRNSGPRRQSGSRRRIFK